LRRLRHFRHKRAGGHWRPRMSEPNWVARIIFSLLAVLVIGILVAGYYEGGKAPAQQLIEEAVPNAPG
jgi:hypothetical protein